MSTRRLSILAAGSALILVLATIAAVLVVRPIQPVRLTSSEHAALRVGMSRAEAERILLGPPRNYVRGQATIWKPTPTGRPVSAFVRRGDPALDYFPESTTDGRTQGVWITETGLIAVEFGSDDRVRQTYFSTVHLPGTPNFFTWVGSRPAAVARSLGF